MSLKFGRVLCSIIRRVVPKRILEAFCVCLDEPLPASEFFPGLGTLGEIRDKLSTLKSLTDVEEVLYYCKGLFEREKERQDLFESKASILAGFSGTSTAAILALMAILLDSEQFSQTPKPVQIASMALSAATIVCLVASVLWSLRAISLRSYHQPDPKKIFELANEKLVDVKRERASQYFSSYIKNQFANNRKADAFNCALNYFRNAMIVALVLVLLIAIYYVWDISVTAETAATPTPPTSPSIMTAPASPTPPQDSRPAVTEGLPLDGDTITPTMVFTVETSTSTKVITATIPVTEGAWAN